MHFALRPRICQRQACLTLWAWGVCYFLVVSGVTSVGCLNVEGRPRAISWAVQAEQALPGEVDDSADGADEAEQEQRFARCKPLAPVDSERWHAGEPSRLGRIFYGNDNFFIFFRLHQHLSDR